MDRARDQLLARTALAVDEHGRIARGDFLDGAPDEGHLLAAADELGELTVGLGAVILDLGVGLARAALRRADSSARATLSLTTSLWIGFVMKSNAPSFIASTAVSTVPKPVMIMIGTSGSIALMPFEHVDAGAAFHLEIGDDEVGALLLERGDAGHAAAVTGSWPSFLTVIARPSRIVSLSSMIRIVATVASYITRVARWRRSSRRRRSPAHAPAVIDGDVAHEREAQARALLARRVERLEQLAARLGRNLLAAIPHESHFELSARDLQLHDVLAGVTRCMRRLHRVAGEVEQRPPKLRAIGLNGLRPASTTATSMSCADAICATSASSSGTSTVASSGRGRRAYSRKSLTTRSR